MIAEYLKQKRPRAGIDAQLGALGRFNSTGYIADIRVPTLVVHGKQDAVMPEGTPVRALTIPCAVMCVACVFWESSRLCIFCTPHPSDSPSLPPSLLSPLLAVPCVVKVQLSRTGCYDALALIS